MSEITAREKGKLPERVGRKAKRPGSGSTAEARLPKVGLATTLQMQLLRNAHPRCRFDGRWAF